MELREAMTKLMEIQNKQSAYRHAMSIINFDGQTIAPVGTTANRAHASAILGEEFYKLATGKDTIELIEFLHEHKEELPARDKRMVTLMHKGLHEMLSIPMEEFTEYRKLTIASVAAWKKSKAANDFESFRPYLEKIFATKIQFAKYCAPDMHPYDYCLDNYEDGLNMATCDKFFATLREGLVPLIQKIQAAPQVDDRCIYGEFSDMVQRQFSEYLMDTMGLDRNRICLATTEHPFTTSIGSHHDVRITTHYDSKNFASSMFSVIHEGGHALYDSGSADDLAYTALDGGVSMGIHESQSRFYENYLGRSKEFIEYVYPAVKNFFPESMANATADDLHRAVNKSMPSLIRTEADEVTYCLHIMVRYELEKALLSGELEVKDLPREWSRLYKEYLGVDVPNDTMGVLQDTHWGSGLIGYFPSYALGTAYAAQFLAKMRESVDVEGCMAKGDFSPINDWNREHIWKYGSSLTPQEVFANAAGADFDPQIYIDYLTEKYSKIYNL